MDIKNFNKLKQSFNSKEDFKTMLTNVVNEENIEGNSDNIPNEFVEASPNELALDSVVEISQIINKTKKSFKFIVCDVWLKPNNIFTIINKTKEKIDSNAWILFYDSNTWYVRKPLQAAATVHVKLISSPEKSK